MTTLASAIGAAQPTDDGMRFGVVETINPLTVNVTGGIIPAGIQGSYAPAVGDSVSLHRQDGTWLITGRVGGSEMPYPTLVWCIVDDVAQTNVTNLAASPATINGASGFISKASDSSVIKLDFAFTHFVSAAGIQMQYSVRFTSLGVGAGVVTFPFHDRFWNTTASHLQVSCHRPLIGLPAGDWSFQFYWGALVLPSGSYSKDAGDTFTVCMEER